MRRNYESEEQKEEGLLKTIAGIQVCADGWKRYRVKHESKV